MSITDEDLDQLLQRPTLRERAKHAAKMRQMARDAEQDAEASALADEATAFMRDVLKLTPGEIVGVDLERGTYNVSRAKVEFTLDGIRFRGRYRAQPINITRNGEKISIGEELIFAVEVYRRGNSTWVELDNEDKLAQLGELV